MSRDMIRFEANERVDIGDLSALQDNDRSDLRTTWFQHLFGDSVDPNKIYKGFAVAEDSGGPSSQVEISNGIGIGGTTLPDGSIELGVLFGTEGPGTQNLDFSGQPADTYDIYVRPSIDAGTLANRIFWNDNTKLEEADSIETRYVFGWDVTFDTLSPGTEWQKIAEVVWNGA